MFLGIVDHNQLEEVYDDIYSGNGSDEKPTIGMFMIIVFSHNTLKRIHFLMTLLFSFFLCL